MRIDRSAMIDRLDDFVRSGNGILTGAPGIGKTYSILELTERWTRDSTPYLLVPVDRIGSATDQEIRSVLSIDSDLLTFASETIAAQDERRGILVFDAFDAARSETTRERVLQLIRRAVAESDNKWTVLVTVRLYDASRSEALRALFRDRAVPPLRGGRGIEETRRFEIPALTEHEVDSATDQIVGLRDLIPKSSSDFRELLHVPFNLWLLSQILSAPGPQSPVSNVSSEVQLLALYWKRRVLASSDVDAVRHLLDKVVTRMVAANSLSVRRDHVFEPSLAKPWSETFSSGILVVAGTAEQRVAFAHNILFDYAVSVLLLDDEPRAMHDFISADPARPFFLRPSITFYFTRLWYEARTSFWGATRATLSSDSAHVRLVGRIVPPAVVVVETRSTEDVRPIFDEIDKQTSDANELLLRIFQALRAHKYSSVLVWAEVAAKAVDRPDQRYLWNAVTLASDFLERKESPAFDELKRVVGRLARRALAWALDERKKRADVFVDGIGGTWGVHLVAATFDTDTKESAALIRRVLRLLQEPGFPIAYISRLSDQIASIAPYDPELVADIYLSVFSHSGEGEEVTSFGTPILPMRSTRRQDFGMCEYVLVKEFDHFMRAAPEHATRAAVKCVNAYALTKHVIPYLQEGKTVEDLSDDLTFRGKQAQVVNDFSAAWGDMRHHDEPMELLQKTIVRIENSAIERDERMVDLLLDEVAAHARVSIIWRELLRLGTRHPDAIGGKLAELALSPVLQHRLYYDVVKFVEATYHRWSPSQQGQLQAEIAETVKRAQNDDDSSLRRLADLLLLAIPAEGLKTQDLTARRTELEKEPNRPINRPPVTFTTSSKAYTNEDWLVDKGVDVNDASNRALLETERQLDELDKQFRNQRPSTTDGPTIAAALDRGLKDIATHGPKAAAHVLDLVSTKTTALAQAIAKTDGEVEPKYLELAKSVLLKSAAEAPTESATEEEYTHPGWSPTAQTEAAQGLPWLVIQGGNGAVLDAIEKLTTSTHPPVRYLASLELFRIRWQATERFWIIANEVAKSEKNHVVLSGLLHSLSLMPRNESSKIAEVLEVLESRGLTTPDERSALADSFTQLLAWLALNVEEPWAVIRFEGFATRPLKYGKLTQRVAFQALTVVSADYLQDEKVRPIALRAIAWLRRLLSAVSVALPALKSPTAEQWQAEVLYGIVDDVAARLYFHARPENKLEGPADPLKLKAYYDAIKPILEDVVQFGRSAESTLLARTAHHVMELLHLCIALDPRGVLRLAADVAQASERSGYNLDSMAVKEVVEIADTLLANYRNELQAGESLEDFVRLLDTFASAGWPDALRLIWRLDEVFR